MSLLGDLKRVLVRRANLVLVVDFLLIEFPALEVILFGELDLLQPSKKGLADFVSAADLRSEEILFEELSKWRPKYGFVMEERGEVEGADNSNRWVVDPLDGTTNFLHGLPQFAISICLERDRQPPAGVIFNPGDENSSGRKKAKARG